nr:MAG TPA: hypothetical protein [Caudoviricetes sp.]
MLNHREISLTFNFLSYDEIYKIPESFFPN